MKTLTVVLSIVLAAGVVATAQERTAAAQSKPAPALTPLKVQVVLARYNGDRKISSMPYTLFVNATPKTREAPVSMRMGVQVPVPATTFTPATADKPATAPLVSYSYRNVGTNIDTWASPTDDGRFNVHLGIEQTSISTEEMKGRSIPDQPLFRSFNSSFSVVLKDGETTQYVTATDPVSGEVLKIDVTLNVLK